LVVHTDIPGNDFTALLDLVAQSPKSYLGDADVFSGAEAKSFYEPLFPPGFLGGARPRTGPRSLPVDRGSYGRAAGWSSSAGRRWTTARVGPRV
jgi:hypothetical protein